MTVFRAARDSSEPPGVTPRGDGVNVAVFSANATAIEFCLFDGEREARRVRLRGRTGGIFHDHIADVPPGARYGLRAHGPFLPSEGHRFNPTKLLMDPYATAIDRPFVLHPSMFTTNGGSSFDETDSAPFMPKGIVAGPNPSCMPNSTITSWPDTTIYELHIRGFTAQHPDVPVAWRGRFAGLGHPAAIAHLLRLGVTTIEIMPAAAWIEERHLSARGLRNYWGYNPVAFMAPDPILAPGGWDEVRSAVDALASSGIEVIVDVVLNHSGEGDELGPTLSFRGLDNATYYRAVPGLPWRYADDTGCGNTLALDRPAPLRFAMDALRVWAARGGVHGFRFDLATTLGRRDAGFDPASPLLSAIAQDPTLRNLKLIAEPWDIGPGGYRIGAFPAEWGEWNDRFRDSVRRFWRGDPAQLGELATRLAGSGDLFARRHAVSRSINFVVAHDGFTLSDLVSYTNKVNWANAENNRDGTDSNYSWNNGTEGPTSDPGIAAARRRDQRALLATLILARGTPMLAMGAEFGHSQGGNNNAYAQDNPESWLDWASADHGLLQWTSRLLQIRRDHPVFHDDRFLNGKPFDISLYPDVEWRDSGGHLMSEDAWRAPGADTLVMTLAGTADIENATARVSLILHRGQEEREVSLPHPRAGFCWRVIADSAADAGPIESLAADDSSDPLNGGRICEASVTAPARGVLVLLEQPRDPRKPVGSDPSLLDRLSRAAGIAQEWWTVEGRRTVVSDDSKRALLSAMRLPVTTDGEARDTIRRLSECRDRRAIPHAVVAREGQAISLRLGFEPGLSRRAFWLTVIQEDGETRRIRFAADDGEITVFTAADGLPAYEWHVELPRLPQGRHRVWKDDAPETICHLTVAPRGCYLPESIRKGGKRFCISAQLYALRRSGDQGIGDFTTLALLAEKSGRAGAASVGINPMHMLFPGQRERASPYHPSDRRFIDPIYLDVSTGSADPYQGNIGRIELEELSGGVLSSEIAYSEMWKFKREVLERQFSEFLLAEKTDARHAVGFRDYVASAGSDLSRFATFQVIAETFKDENWGRWPVRFRSPDSNDVTEFAHANAERLRFHQYLQFQADRQLAAAAARAAASGLEFGLFRDLAVGAAPDGAEAWAGSANLASGAWIGAPPDPFSADGQNWHLPPPLPLNYEQDGFSTFSALIAANTRHAGVLRIDHAMGLSRLFWIPDGGNGADGAYVTYPFAGLLGQVALESVRSRCMMIGEDLGTVPDGFRPAMEENDILSYRVLFLEREGIAFRPAASYPRRAAACVSTHDLPPLAGWWEGDDIAERAALGQITDHAKAQSHREAEREALLDLLVDQGCLAKTDQGAPPVDHIVAAAYRHVASAESELMLVQADDLAGMRVGVNLPGTDTERPNWRLRLKQPVETLMTTEIARSILGGVIASGRGSNTEDV